MDLDSIKKETMNALGITDPAEVSYITEALIKDYDENSREYEKNYSDVDDLVKKDLEYRAMIGFGAYGNSLVFRSGYVDYKAGPRGTPNYGCGSENWRWRSDPGDTFTQTGRTCPNGQREYLLNCPTCI